MQGSSSGAMILPGGVLECVVDTKFAAGTHSIFVGRVGVVAVEESDRLPLIYSNGCCGWNGRQAADAVSATISFTIGTTLVP